MGCESCQYVEDNGSKRLRELETIVAVQKQESRTTNLILGRIEEALTLYIKDSKADIEKNEDGIKANVDAINAMKPSAAVLQDRSDTQKQLNMKSLTWLISIVMFFLSIISSIIFN